MIKIPQSFQHFALFMTVAQQPLRSYSLTRRRVTGEDAWSRGQLVAKKKKTRHQSKEEFSFSKIVPSGH